MAAQAEDSSYDDDADEMDGSEEDDQDQAIPELIPASDPKADRPLKRQRVE